MATSPSDSRWGCPSEISRRNRTVRNSLSFGHLMCTSDYNPKPYLIASGTGMSDFLISFLPPDLVLYQMELGAPSFKYVYIPADRCEVGDGGYCVGLEFHPPGLLSATMPSRRGR